MFEFVAQPGAALKVKIKNYKNQYILYIDKPNTPRLALTTNHFSSGQWSIEDVRLQKNATPSRYYSVGADLFWAQQDTTTSEHAAFVRKWIPKHKEKLPNSDSQYKRQ